MNKEQLKTKIYRKRDWGIDLPLHQNLKGLETQVQDLSKFIIEDILKVDEEAEKRLTFFKENDFENFKTDVTIDADGIKSVVSELKSDIEEGLAENSSLIQQTATEINLKITDGDYLVSQINVGLGGVSISGNKIKLNDNFIVDELGNVCVKQISASLLTAGVIDADQITVRNLKADSITTGSIVTEKIEDGAITTDKISVDGLNASVISAGTIDAQKVSIINLSAEQITVGKINGNQITSNSITGTQIANGVITTEKIHVNGISADKITTGTLQVGNGLIVQGVINGNLAEFTNIKAQNITVGTINGNQISDNTLGNNHINDLSATKLTAGTINANIITVNNLNASNITSGTLHADRITIGSVSNDKLAGGITGNKMVPGTITGTQIANGVITTDKIAVNGISADKITTGTLNATDVSIINLNATNITSGTLNANRLNIGTEFSVDGTGKLTVKEISASKIKAGEIDASLITVKNLNADNITAGKLNGGNIGDGQIGTNHMREISADKITGGTIISSSFISSNGVESTTINAGKITFSKNGNPVTVIRNIKVGVVKTDHLGTGRIIFSDMNKNMSVLTALKSFNMPGNIMNAECFAECINIYTNVWKFTLRGSTQSVSTSIKTTHSKNNASIDCTELNLISFSIDRPNKTNSITDLCKGFDFESYPIINIKVYCNSGDGSEKIVFDEDHIVRFDKVLYQEQDGKKRWVIKSKKIIKDSTITVSTANLTTKTLRIVLQVVKSDFIVYYSNYPESNLSWRKTYRLELAPPYEYNKFEMITSHRVVSPSNFSGSGEVQYIAIEN